LIDLEFNPHGCLTGTRAAEVRSDGAGDQAKAS
jgi:hypothetical protein